MNSTLSVWVPSGDAVDCNPAGLLAQSNPVYSRADEHCWAIWRFILRCHVCSCFLSLLQSLVALAASFPAPDSGGKEANLPRSWEEHGLVGGWRLGFEMCFSIGLFSMLPFCRSVTTMHLPFKIALPKLNFFSPNGSPCSLFLLPLFLCRPDQRWQ